MSDKETDGQQLKDGPLAGRPSTPPNPVHGMGDAGFWGDDDPKYGRKPEEEKESANI